MALNHRSLRWFAACLRSRLRGTYPHLKCTLPGAQGEITDPCGLPFSGNIRSLPSMIPAVSHISINASRRPSLTRLRKIANSSVVLQVVEESTEVAVDHIADTLIEQPLAKIVQCLMATSDRGGSRRRSRRSPARKSAPTATPRPWRRSCLPEAGSPSGRSFFPSLLGIHRRSTGWGRYVRLTSFSCKSSRLSAKSRS